MRNLNYPIIVSLVGICLLMANITFISSAIAGALVAVAAMYMYAYFFKSLDSAWYLAMMLTEGLTLNQLFPNPNLKFGAILVLLVACGIYHPILAIIIAGGIFCEQQLTK